MGLVRELFTVSLLPLNHLNLYHRPSNRRTIQAVLHLPLHMFGKYILGRLRRLGHTTILGIERSLEHVVKVAIDLIGSRTNECLDVGRK